MDRLLNEHEAAAIVGLSVSTLQKARLTGLGPPFAKLGRSVRYREQDLRTWVEERIARSTSEKVAA